MYRVAGWALALTACGRFGFEALPGDVSVWPLLAIDAGPATLLPWTHVQLRATIDGVETPDVTWSIDSGGGAVTATGEYAAPASTVTVTLRATSTIDPLMFTTLDVAITLPQQAPATIVTPTGTGDTFGMAHQTHLIRTESGEWWYWYITSNDPTHVHTRHSTDFVQWSEGATATLSRTHGNDGRNIDLAYKRINGVDVIHGTVGFIDTARGRFHVKAVVTPGTITFETPQQINFGGNVEPDGPATVITQSGLVIDGTGWDATPQTPPLSPCGDGDLEMYTAAQVDTGATSFAAMTFTRQVVWCVPVRINARELIADGDTVYELYDDGLSDPQPRNLLYNIRRPDGTWLPDETVKTMPPRVFNSDVFFDLNDWAVARLGNTLHAIRTTASTIEHRTFVLGSEGTWSDAPTLAPVTTNIGSGLVLAPYGTGLLAAMLETSSVQYAFFDGAVWSPWTVLTSGAAVKIGSGGGGVTERPALLWELPSSAGINGVVLP